MPWQHGEVIRYTKHRIIALAFSVAVLVSTALAVFSLWSDVWEFYWALWAITMLGAVWWWRRGRRDFP